MFYWGVLNAHIDMHFFYVGLGSFLDFLIFNVPTPEAYARTLVLGICIIFGYIFSKIYYEHLEYKLLLEYSLDKSYEAIFLLNKNGGFYRLNKNKEENFAYDIKDFLNLNIHDLKDKGHIKFKTKYINKDNDFINVEVIQTILFTRTESTL